MDTILELGDDVCHLFAEFDTRRDAISAGKNVAIRFGVRTVVVSNSVYILEPTQPSGKYGFADAWQFAQKLQGRWTDEDSHATQRDEFVTDATSEEQDKQNSAIASHYAYFSGGSAGKPLP